MNAEMGGSLVDPSPFGFEFRGELCTWSFAFRIRLFVVNSSRSPSLSNGSAGSQRPQVALKC